MGFYVFGTIFFSIIIILLFILLYFLPGIIACKRDHEYKVPILLLNFLLGWTFIGWAGTLVWAFIDTNGNKILKNNSNKYDDIAKLNQLKQSGAITEIEFEIEKSKILK